MAQGYDAMGGLGKLTADQIAEQKMFEEFSRRHIRDAQAAWQWLDEQRSIRRVKPAATPLPTPQCECDSPVIANGTANLCVLCGRQDTNYVGQERRRGR